MRTLIPNALRFSTVGICFIWMVLGQAGRAAAVDGWHGLTLGTSTPTDAIGILGKPNHDQKNAFGSFEPPWGTYGLYSLVKHERKDLREMRFDRVDGFRSVQLTFCREALVSVRLEPEHSISIDEFRSLYKTDLKFWNLNKFDQLFGQFDPAGEPTNATLTGEGGPYSLFRRFYVMGTQNENLIGAFGSTFNTAEHGSVDNIILVHKNYFELRSPDRQRPASELLK